VNKDPYHSEPEGVSLTSGPANPQALTWRAVMPAWGPLWVPDLAWDTDASKKVPFSPPDSVVQLMRDLREEWAWTVTGYGRGIALGVDFVTYGRLWRPGPYVDDAPKGDADF
jgi:hypothetical protein